MKERRVILGFSGGIDSSAAVSLLRDQGYDVTALTLDMTGDRSLLDKAQRRAGELSVPLRVRSVRDTFGREVVDYFTDSYRHGRTPAPCTRCNSRIKWPYLAAEADALGIPFLATGHYFRITQQNGKYYVTRATDLRKDQSYYLWDLPQEILARTVTPMGNVIKQEVAAQSSDRRESMGICFLGRESVCDFLQRRAGAFVSGEIVDSEGRTLGRHDGVALYTIGQKRGLNLPGGYAVVGIDAESNRLIVGTNNELFHATLEVGQCRLVDPDEVFATRDLQVVIRGIGRNPAAGAVVIPTRSGIRIELDDPAWAPAIGQPVVLYCGDRVVGGGILEGYR